MRYISRLLTMGALAILAGCATTPNIDCQKAKTIQVGMSQQDAVSALGQPYMISIARENLTMRWQNNELNRLATQALEISVNPQTKLIRSVSGTCSR